MNVEKEEAEDEKVESKSLSLDDDDTERGSRDLFACH